MHVIEQPAPTPMPIPGIAHATWAGSDEGLAGLSLWRQTLAPGAATPPHRHDCDEAVLCLAGRGTLRVDGQAEQGFGAGQTLVLPRAQTHQVLNTGDETLELIGIFGASPVGTFDPEGRAIALPWRS